MQNQCAATTVTSCEEQQVNKSYQQERREMVKGEFCYQDQTINIFSLRMELILSLYDDNNSGINKFDLVKFHIIGKFKYCR